MATKHRGTESERRALDLVIKLSRACDSVGGRTSLHFAGTGITPSQFGVLDALYHSGPLCLGEIARKHLRSPNNITSVVDTMERSRLVERVRSESDRRMILVHLTHKGRELYEGLWPDHLQAVVQAVSALTSDEQETLAELCKKLGKSLVKD